MTPRKDEHIEVTASKGALSFIRWLLPLFLSTLTLTGGGAVANDLNKRVQTLEEIVTNNTIEINGQSIELKNYNARIIELQEDIRESRTDIKQILIILQKK
jgi:hypothetical protein